jgi:hypothetical protein
VCPNPRRKNQGDFIAHAARGMLVHFDSRKPREIDGFSRMHHGVGQRDQFFAAHAVEIDRHEKRAHLVIGNPVQNVIFDGPGDLFFGENFSVSFFDE